MKKTLLAILSVGCNLVYGQYYTQYFDGADTSVWEAVFVYPDTSANNIWQIGPPQKILFDSPSTVPNVLVTDTINNYPDSVNCYAWFNAIHEPIWGVLAVQWMQKLDLDSAKDVGFVEFSDDSGATWQNAFYHPSVYNFYGWDLANHFDTGSDGFGFTGTDTTWKNVWLCFDPGYVSGKEHLFVRYRIVSDSINTNQEGWMIDNLMVAVTWFHPITENSKPDNFKIYPTLANRSITLEQINTDPALVIEQITLLDMSGNIVRNIQINNSVEYIDVSDIPAGHYILKIVSNLKKETHPVIISH